MRRFEVEVVKTDKYIVEIDECKLEKDFIEEFERFIHNLGEDKIKGLAKYIGSTAMDNNDDFYEGIGYIRRDGETFSEEVKEGIEVKVIYTDDYEVETCEMQ